jgi:hypothetical protein
VTLLVGWMCLAYFGIEDGIEHASGGESPAGPRRRIGRARSGVSSPHIDAWRPLSAQVNWATAQGAG